VIDEMNWCVAIVRRRRGYMHVNCVCINPVPMVFTWKLYDVL